MRILIICFDFPPVNRVASLRPYGMARYWSRAGAEVKVLTTRRQRPGIPLNRVDMYGDLASFEIIEADHQKWMFWLPRNDIKPLEPSTTAPSPVAAPPPTPTLVTRIKKAALTLVRAVKAGSFFCPTNTWTTPATRAGRELYQRWPFDVVVSSFGPAACHIVAHRLRKNIPFFWVADYRDLWGGSDLLPVRWPFTSMEKWREQRVVADADLLSSVSQPLVDHLRATFPKKPVLLVENGYDKEDEATLPPKNSSAHEESAESAGRCRLIYAGALALNHRSPDPLFEALARLKARRPDLLPRLHISFHTTHRDFLHKDIRKWGLEGIVTDGGYLPRNEILHAQRRSDGLIFLEWNNPNSKGILTGKLSEYLHAGVPILCVGGQKDSDASALIENHGFGVALGSDVASIEQYLENLAGGGRIPYSPDLSLLARFDRRQQMESFLGEIESAVARTRPADAQTPNQPPKIMAAR